MTVDCKMVEPIAPFGNKSGSLILNSTSSGSYRIKLSVAPRSTAKIFENYVEDILTMCEPEDIE